MDMNVYEMINDIALHNEDGRIVCKHIVDFDESDDDIIFVTEVPMENIQRGWVGDMFVHLNGVRLLDMRHDVTATKSINNVLLSKITVSCAPGEVVRWKYTFLKD